MKGRIRQFVVGRLMRFRRFPSVLVPASRINRHGAGPFVVRAPPGRDQRAAALPADGNGYSSGLRKTPGTCRRRLFRIGFSHVRSPPKTSRLMNTH
jgi:hypothetical protein